MLLVDTDADTRDMYELAFTLDGFRTASTATAFEGFAAALDLAPAVIVADVGAPGRSQAFEMVSWLRRDTHTRDIPVVALTGYDLTAETDRSPFERILLKPVSPDALVLSARAAVVRAATLRARARRVPARMPDGLQRSSRAVARSAQPVSDHPARRRCPRCRAQLTYSFERVIAERSPRQYRPCRNGCGLFYYDPVAKRMIPVAG